LAFDELTETDEDVMLLRRFVDVEEDEDDFNEASDVLLTAILNILNSIIFKSLR